MKVFKSIKWRLQIWYGLILVTVLAGFGVTAYQLERGRQMRRMDDEINHRFDVLARMLHGPLRRAQMQPPNEPFDRPPPGRFPGDIPHAQNWDLRPPAEFHLPADQAYLFDASDPNDFYFMIFTRGGELARSTNAPAAEIFSRAEKAMRPAGFPPGQVDGRRLPSPEKVEMQFASFRAIGRSLPSGETIFVGCSIAPELRELRKTALKLAGVGGIILLLGSAGGGWLVRRALRPISEISSTAAKISAGDLSQRINAAEAESELGQLAAVLNSTFARLETAFAQQKQFAADAAHELRTPVSVLLTQTQAALNRERDAASYRQTVEACQRAAQRMRKLIESLLALARFDAGQEVLNRQRFDLSGTIGECVEMLQPLADERGVKLLIEAGPLEITGDAGRLAQVVTNLLTNAIQYNHPGGEARVKLESQNGLAVLTVADTGEGIAAENLPRVFDRFFRADESRTGTGNAGLGLVISKAIVEAHGGTIEVASTQNAGTIFTVRLPV